MKHPLKLRKGRDFHHEHFIIILLTISKHKMKKNILGLQSKHRKTVSTPHVFLEMVFHGVCLGRRTGEAREA